jgi:hypothetical protein
MQSTDYRRKSAARVVPLMLLNFSLAINVAQAIPSGLSSLPADLRIPKVGNRILPVELLPSDGDPKQIYVKPLEGQFVNQGVIKSPITSCELVADELKISEINNQARLLLQRSLKQAIIDNERLQEKKNIFTREFEKLLAISEPMAKQVEQLEAEKREALQAVKDGENSVQGNRELITIEKDKEKIASLNQANEKLEVEIDQAKKSFVAVGKKLREAKSRNSALELSLAEVKGKKIGLEKTLMVQMAEKDLIQTQLDKNQAASDAVLQKYSERIGGYTTITSEFAPSSYLVELKTANPGYQFQYVSSVTATVEATIPGNIRPGSSLDTRIGTMILDAKWSDPERALSDKAFRRSIPAPHDRTEMKDSVKLAQDQMPRLESSLTGTKFLSLQLSILGYCGLTQPESLKSEFTGGAADTFKLALYYTYPVNYDILISGRLNSYQMLYELKESTKSSGFLGLSKSEKQKHVRNLSSSKAIDVSVKPRGMILSPADSMALLEKVREQLHLYSIEPYLDKSQALPSLAAPHDVGELGASSVGKRLMAIPNPYAFWGGMVLVGLSELFGSSSSQSIQEISNNSWVTVNYQAGFSFLTPADLTIGDLRRAQVKVK